MLPSVYIRETVKRDGVILFVTVIPSSNVRSRLAELRTRISPGAQPSEAEGAAPRGADQDRIYSVVSGHGGSVRQQTIIEETGWSPSKVSRLLQEMERASCVDRSAVGREKVVELPE